MPRELLVFEDHPAEQWGAFLHSYLVLMGALTPNQAHDRDDVIRRALREGLDLAAQHYEGVGYRSFRHMSHCAEYGKLYRKGARQ